MDVLERFLSYVQIDTPSDPDNDTMMPSNPQEFDLANRLAQELRDLGVNNADVDENCYVYASIPANVEGAPAIGFIAHMDVVCEAKGYGVKPCIHQNYQGGALVLANGDKILPATYPFMNDYIGQDIVTSDGTTILGADDKAGVAEIMALVEYLMQNPDVPHGKIGIAFTPDEEIGNGASRFDVKRFACDFAYTVDGEELGEISYETFNAAAFEFDIKGLNIHPGSAKDKMVNALIVALEIVNAFPAQERPEHTEKREGYFFFQKMDGSVENAHLSGIVREHDKQKFTERKAFVQSVADEIAKKYPDRVKFEMHDQYYNCAEVIMPHYHLVDTAANVMTALGVKPIIQPIRGGTDGSGLSFKGLPCPNLCTGGFNAHGTHEFVPVPSLFKVVEILKGIVATYSHGIPKA